MIAIPKSKESISAHLAWLYNFPYLLLQPPTNANYILRVSADDIQYNLLDMQGKLITPSPGYKRMPAQNSDWVFLKMGRIFLVPLQPSQEYSQVMEGTYHLSIFLKPASKEATLDAKKWFGEKQRFLQENLQSTVLDIKVVDGKWKPI